LITLLKRVPHLRNNLKENFEKRDIS